MRMKMYRLPKRHHPLVDTEGQAAGWEGRRFPTALRRHYKEDFGVVSSPFLSKAVLISRLLFIVENSVISLILKFKYINFYLCISILVRLCLCVSASGGV